MTTARAITIIPALLIALSLTSCNRIQTMFSYWNMKHCTISIPDSLHAIGSQNIINLKEAKQNGNILIMYVDSTECSECFLEHLRMFNNLYTEQENYNYYVMPILVPPSREAEAIVRRILRLDLPYTFYIDTSDSFRRSNPKIPDDSRFHTFLIDSCSRPVFIGFPLESDKHWGLFIETLNNNNAL